MERNHRRDACPHWKERAYLNHKALREEVVLVSRRMSEAGLAVGTSGNVSARTPDGRFLLKPSGRHIAAMEPEDAVLPDLDGAVFESSTEPSVEWPMHAGIYRARPETRVSYAPTPATRRP
jgi:ribulose-5-phosphate 4-epimerase/fuculose-1-phosphate aldolase